MSVAHLNGKRTGRTKGSKSRPYWRRAVEWVQRHLGDLDAVPPSPLAKLLLQQAQTRPDLFTLMLATIEQRQAPSPAPNKEPVHLGMNSYERPLPIKRLVVSNELVTLTLKPDKDKLLPLFPKGWGFLDVCSAGTETIVILRSDSFPTVQPGEPIPTWRVLE